MPQRWRTAGSIVAGLSAAIGASACCAGPLLLVVLGIGGAWGARLAALQPYQPIFVAAALAAFGYAYVKLFRAEPACEPGEACALPAVRRRRSALFWISAVAASALMGFPLYAPLFY